MGRLLEVITNVRNLRQNANLKPKEMASVELFCEESKLITYLNSQSASFEKLANVASLKVLPRDHKKPLQALMSATPHTDVYLLLEDLSGIKEQMAKLKKDIEKAKKEFEKYDKKLNNPKFLENAKEDAIIEAKFEHEQASTKLESLTTQLNLFEKTFS